MVICKQDICCYLGLNNPFLPLALVLCDCMTVSDDVGLWKEKSMICCMGRCKRKGAVEGAVAITGNVFAIYRWRNLPFFCH